MIGKGMSLLLRLLPNLEISDAANNALLVELMLSSLTETEEDKCQLAHRVADIYRAGGNRSSTDVQALRNLDEQKRVVQLNFIALALEANGIQPTIPGRMWMPIRNPFRLGNVPKLKIDKWVKATAHFLAKSHPELTSPQAKSIGITLSLEEAPLSFLEWINTPAARLMSIANGWCLIDDLIPNSSH